MRPCVGNTLLEQRGPTLTLLGEPLHYSSGFCGKGTYKFTFATLKCLRGERRAGWGRILSAGGRGVVEPRPLLKSSSLPRAGVRRLRPQPPIGRKNRSLNGEGVGVGHQGGCPGMPLRSLRQGLRQGLRPACVDVGPGSPRGCGRRGPVVAAGCGTGWVRRGAFDVSKLLFAKLEGLARTGRAGVGRGGQ